MTKILAISAHPSIEDSQFTRPFIEALDDDLFEKKILSRLYPDWRFDVAREQADLTSCRAIVFVFPFHWYAPPALLHKWFADVLVETDRFKARETLTGKTVHTVISTGGDRGAYRREGENGFSVEQFLRPFEATIGYIGAVFHSPVVHYATYRLNETDVCALARRFEEHITNDASHAADDALRLPG